MKNIFGLVFALVLFVAAPARSAAKALIDFLASPAATATIHKTGLEPLSR